ncbi:MAG TPA: hypothetical protein PLF40_17475 [Kofleriaceae bacterium]|nr:hypothetical protein [Kofleriaceae bacterium]
MGDIAAAWQRFVPQVRSHWKSCAEAGLPHTDANLHATCALFETFVRALDAKAPPLDEIRKLYAGIDMLNEQHDGGLFETDERELLVTWIIQAAEMAGINPADHDGEPGSEWRDF